MLASLIHRLRCRLSPAYNTRAREYDFALAMERSHRELDFQRECWANDQAANLRLMGHPCPVGTVLAGVTVTR